MLLFRPGDRMSVRLLASYEESNPADSGLINPLRGEWTHLFFTTRTAIALAYLSTFGAIGGFVAYTYALRHLKVSFVSLYAYINPMIAVALGVAVLGEPFDIRMAAAAALVFSGVAIVRWTNLEPRRRAA